MLPIGTKLKPNDYVLWRDGDMERTLNQGMKIDEWMLNGGGRIYLRRKPSTRKSK